MKKNLLKKGDKVSLQSLSGGMAGEYEIIHRFYIGKERIAELGLEPIVSTNALKGSEWISQHPEDRAKDLMEAITNPDIKAIIANIGGNDSHKLIEFLDSKKIKKNPKPLIGYSDITSLHLYFYSLGIQTYYGPSVLDGFAENGSMHHLTKQSIETILFEDNSQEIVSSSEWTSEFLDWKNEENTYVNRKMNRELYGYVWVNISENIQGKLVGGCLDTITQIKEKSFFPKISLWKDTIIFLETSENKMSPKEFEKSLLLLNKEIQVSKAVIFGKPKDEKYLEEYISIAKRIISKPMIFNVNFGHTAPMYTLPYGGTMNLNVDQLKIEIKK